MSAARMLAILAAALSLLGCAEPAAPAVVVGVNVTNPQWLPRAEQDAILEQLAGSGVTVIRVPLENEASLDLVRRAHARGIATVAIVWPRFRPGATVRPAVEGYPWVYPQSGLSDADAKQLTTAFGAQLASLERAGVRLAAIELGNEINWAPFNGDFDMPGQGRILDYQALSGTARGRKIATGYRAYVTQAAALRRVRDASRLNAATPIVSAGLSDTGPPGPRREPVDGVEPTATLRYLREHGLDAAVDAYGLHTYPDASPRVTAPARRAQLEGRLLKPCAPPGRGKPCWITEWGLPNESRRCPAPEAGRTAATASTLQALQPALRGGRVQGLIYYNWREDARLSVYRCGALTGTGRLALSPQPAPSSRTR